MGARVASLPSECARAALASLHAWRASAPALAPCPPPLRPCPPPLPSAPALRPVRGLASRSRGTRRAVLQVDGSAAYHLAMCDDIGNAAYDTQGARAACTTHALPMYYPCTPTRRERGRPAPVGSGGQRGVERCPPLRQHGAPRVPSHCCTPAPALGSPLAVPCTVCVRGPAPLTPRAACASGVAAALFERLVDVAAARLATRHAPRATRRTCTHTRTSRRICRLAS